jgi:tetratricopeptide (TPR) repeat protein
MQSRSGVATDSANVRRTYAAVVFSCALSLYGLTLAPTVTLVDSGELIVAARSLGVAHPPGFPLYVLLANLATRFPIGNIAMRVNLASALFGALAAAVVTLVVAEILLTPRPQAQGRTRQKESKKGAKRSPSASNETDASFWVVLLPALLSGLLLSFSRTLWSYSTVTEVYSLNTLVLSLVFLLLLRWRSQAAEHKGARRDLLLYVAASLFGLALGVHHVSVGLALPAMAAIVYSTEGFKFFNSRRLVYAALSAIAGLCVYAYLPIAASRSPLMNWGDPRTLERFWWHVTGRQYQIFFSPSLETMMNQFGVFIKLVGREFGPWWLPAGLILAVAGLVLAFKHDKSAFWFLALIVVVNVPYALNYEIAEDKDAYYLPTFMAMAIAAGFGAHWLIRALSSRRRLAFAGLLIVPLIGLLSSFPYNNRGRYFIARDYGDNIMSTVESRGMLLTVDWQVYSPMLYTLEIEKRRPDMICIDLNQLRRSWYFDYLNKAYPELMEKTRDKVDAFLEDLRNWEHDAKIYDQDNSLNQRINTRYNEMILAFCQEQLHVAPVYITQELVVGGDGNYRDLTKAFETAYQFVPQGLVFEMTPTREFREPSDPRLVTRGLTDGSLRFEKDDVVSIKVLPVYLSMLVNRGRYLAAFGRHERAIQAFNQALALDPNYSVAQRLRDQSDLALRKAGSGGAR